MSKNETSSNLPKHLDSPDFVEFRKAIQSTDEMSIVEYFDAMPEKDRQRHAKYCLDYCKAVEKEYIGTPLETIRDPNEDGFVGTTIQHSAKGMKLAEIWQKAKSSVVATSSWATLKNVNWFYELDEIGPILRSRRPEWTLDFLAKIIGGIELHFRMEPYWDIYRNFYREGIIQPKRFDSITELMFAVLSGSRFTERWKREKGENVSNVMAGLKNDPDLIKNELWHVFEIEAFRRNWCYTTHDAFNLWKETFCELIANGKIPQNRVIDGCFQALTRPFTDHQLKWFVQLLDMLIEKHLITDDELADDAGRYLGLLDHIHATPRALGLKIVERLLKINRVPVGETVPRLGVMLREPVKAKAKKTLTLLDKIAKGNEKFHGEICLAAIEGLQHELAEIQQMTLDLLLKYRAFDDPALNDAVQKIGPALAASVRKNLPQSEITAKQEIAKKILPPKSEIPVTREILKPIQTFDELLDLAVKLVESANDPDEIEQFLDGLCRLGTEKPQDFTDKTAPLLKRIIKLLGTQPNTYTSDKTAKQLGVFLPFTGENIAADCFHLILSWVAGEIPTFQPLEIKSKFYKGSVFSELTVLGKRWIHWTSANRSDSSAYRIFSEYAKSIAEAVVVHGISRQRLCTPTHRNGWIDPLVFVKRLSESYQTKTVHDDNDRVLALLRLDFSGRKEALTMLDSKIKKRDEYVQAVRYALGAEKCRIGKTAHYWIAAGRSRLPFDDIHAIEMAFPSFGPDAGEAAIYVIEKGKHEQLLVRCEPVGKKKCNAALFPTMALHASNSYDHMEARQENTWKLTVWPSNPDPVIGAAIQSHFSYREDAYETGFIPYIEVLQRADVTIRKIGAAAIFAGLSMKHAPIPMAATDTMIIAIAQNRLKPEPVHKAVRELLATQLPIPSRWLKPLQIVADQSEQHTYFVREILENMIPHLDTKAIGGFLELLYEIVITLEQPVQNKTCLKYLKSVKGTGKATKLAKKLLEL